MARNFILNSLLFSVDIYKKIISPFLPNSCRFYPSCSNYSKEALSEYGILKGVFLSIVRLIKCNPFCSGGYDPVNKKSAQ